MKRPHVIVLLVVLIALSAVAAEAKDQWIQVRTKNFYLIGNASEKDVKHVAVKMEQFRETFRLLFPHTNLTAAKPTNIVVFKSKDSYRPFLPRRSNGKADNFIAGYFQPGEDVNYITLSTEGEDNDTFETIFHEYVHFILDTNFGRSDIPAWFNEGLAEYYSTFRVEGDRKIILGYPALDRSRLLAQSKLIPLSDLFNVSNRGLHTNSDRLVGVFYAEAWALIHYLMLTDKGDSLSAFVTELRKNTPPQTAFKNVFKTDYADMEKDLRKYVGAGIFKYQIVTLKNELNFEQDITVSSLDDTSANAYLGDLLYHSNRPDDAEPYLQKALAGDPRSVMANTAMGMTKIRERKYAEAKPYLESAVAADSNNYLALYWNADLLRREGSDEFGRMEPLSSEKARVMRDLLLRSINAKPQFAQSADMLGYIALVSQEGLDDALGAIKKALQYQPGDQRLRLRGAEILAAQKDFKSAISIAEKIAASSDDEEVQSRASNFIERVKAYSEKLDQYEAAKKEFQNRQNHPPTISNGSGRELSPDEAAKLSLDARNSSITASLRKPAADEELAIGHVTRIACVKGVVEYSFVTGDKTMELVSKDFQGLELTTFSDQEIPGDFGCKTDVSKLNAVVLFKKAPAPTRKATLVMISFVPADFAFTEQKSTPVRNVTGTGGSETIVVTTSQGTGSGQAAPADSRAAMIEGIKGLLLKPGVNEVRQMGTIEKLECGSSDAYMYFTTSSGQVKVSFLQSAPPKIRGFTAEVQNINFNCGMKQVDVPVVFIYRRVDKPKGKAVGELLSLEFVPKGLTIE